jgi:hypothetical protein
MSSTKTNFFKRMRVLVVAAWREGNTRSAKALKQLETRTIQETKKEIGKSQEEGGEGC